MVRWYPGDLVRSLARRYPPEAVHSVVVVTKFPEAILSEPVRSALARYDQVVVQVTITGLGGTPLEPRVPPAETSLAALPRLIDFVGHPDRVLVRIDPIVHWRKAPGGEREAHDGPGPRPPAGQGEAGLETNLAFFAEIARRSREAGVTLVKTSLASPYPKALRRFREAGLELVDPTGAERERVLEALERAAGAAGVRLEFCCEPTRPRAACVDAERLTHLHPKGLPARPDHPAGQREACGCSHSIDLAWYSSHPCPSGCLYCYANPIPARRPPRPGEAGPRRRTPGPAGSIRRRGPVAALGPGPTPEGGRGDAPLS